MNNEHTKAAHARDEHVDIPLVALKDLPAVAAAMLVATPADNRRSRISKKNDLVAPDFRETASKLAGQLQHADRNVMSLVAELDAAGLIIQTMLRHLTVAQKLHISIDLESRGIISDGMTRHHERKSVTALAKQYAMQNWSTQ
jgi:hypothetical protein